MPIRFSFADRVIEKAVMLQLSDSYTAEEVDAFLQRQSSYFQEENSNISYFELELHGHSSPAYYMMRVLDAGKFFHPIKHDLEAVIYGLTFVDSEEYVIVPTAIPLLQGDQKNGKEGLTNKCSEEIGCGMLILYVMNALHYL